MKQGANKLPLGSLEHSHGPIMSSHSSDRLISVSSLAHASDGSRLDTCIYNYAVIRLQLQGSPWFHECPSFHMLHAAHRRHASHPFIHPVIHLFFLLQSLLSSYSSYVARLGSPKPSLLNGFPDHLKTPHSKWYIYEYDINKYSMIFSRHIC